MQAFIEGLTCLAGATARYRTADVALVRDRAAKAEQRVADEDRRDHRNVRRVRAAAVIGMVDDERVARRDTVAKRVDDGGGAGGKCADMERQHHVLRHHLALGVHQRTGGILRLPHDGGESRTKQRVLHLLHDAGQARLDDFEIDRVDDHRFLRQAFSCHRPRRRTIQSSISFVQARRSLHNCAGNWMLAFAGMTAAGYVTIRFFHSSTRAIWPGQITVVQSN